MGWVLGVAIHKTVIFKLLFFLTKEERQSKQGNKRDSRVYSKCPYCCMYLCSCYMFAQLALMLRYLWSITKTTGGGEKIHLQK